MWLQLQRAIASLVCLGLWKVSQMEINASPDRITRNERRKHHNEQADPQLKSAKLWGLGSAPGAPGQVCGHASSVWCECLRIHLPFLCPGNHRQKHGISLNLLHTHRTDGQHMCDMCVRLAGHLQITLYGTHRQAWMLGCIGKHEGVEKEGEPATLLHGSAN